MDLNDDEVLKLLKALYGLKQAGRCWFKYFVKLLQSIGLKQLRSQRTIFFNEDVLVCVYVDDGLIAEKRSGGRQRFIAALSAKIDITEENELNGMLGLDMTQRVDGSVVISQTEYIKETLQLFQMEQAKAQTVPATPGIHLSREGTAMDGQFDIQGAVGRLLWITRCSRPDIAFSVTQVCRFVAYPTSELVQAVKKIMRYLRGTADYVLRLKSDGTEELKAFVDADYGSCPDTRRSVSGCLIYWSGMPICWSSKIQPIVTTSTCEAEYVAAANGTKEMLWVRNVLRELGIDVGVMLLLEDNQGTIANVKSETSSKKSKHIDVRYHFIRDLYESGELEVHYVSSEENVADLFTKALAC